MDVVAPDDMGPQLDPRTIEVGDVVYYKDTLPTRYIKLQISKITREPDYLFIHSHPRTFGVDPNKPLENQYNKFYKNLGPERRAQKNVLNSLERSDMLPGNITNKIGKYLRLGGRRKRSRKARRTRRRH